MGIVDTTDFVVVHIFIPQGCGEAVDGSVGFLGHSFLYLDLQDQVRAALEVEPEFNLPFEIILDLCQRGGERGIAKKEIETENDDYGNEHRFPLDVWIHG